MLLVEETPVNSNFISVVLLSLLSVMSPVKVSLTLLLTL